MGRSESLDSEEIKFICGQVLRGRTDRQIQSDLAEYWGQGDLRTIRYVRRVFEAGKEVLMESLARTGYSVEGGLADKVKEAVDIVEHLGRGLRPVLNKKTGKMEYETWLEI